MGLYLLGNGPQQTTAAFAAVTTSAVIKTMMQVKPGTTQTARVAAWGCSFDGSAAATPGKVELIETDVAATVTAYAAADITKYDGEALLAGDPTTNMISVGTTASGYTATTEGTITAVRNLDFPVFLPPTAPYVVQFPLDAQPVIQPGKFGRVRVTFGAAINMYCWMLLRL